MRVVAGEARGRRLEAPPGTTTRPTTDRVREATFNALTSLGAVEGAQVVDLFAGSGALGIEALSRGAEHATFVERDRAALAVLRRNLVATGLAGRATVVAADARRWLAGRGDEPADLVLCDPPYATADWPTLLAALPGRVVVAESDRSLAVEAVAAGWGVVREKRYGATVVTIARRVTEPGGDAPPGPPPPTSPEPT